MQTEKPLNDGEEEVLGRLPGSAKQGRNGSVARGRHKSHAAESILKAWSDGRIPDIDSLTSLPPNLERRGDAFTQAATHLALGSGLGRELSPREGLMHLQQANKRFDSLGMDEMSLLVRIEAAWRIREAGFPELALRTLESGAIQQRQELARGVRVCCLLDLGRLAQATEVLVAKDRTDSPAWPSKTPRFETYDLTAKLQVRAAISLMGRGPECHLSPQGLRTGDKPRLASSTNSAMAAGLATGSVGNLAVNVPLGNFALIKPLVALVAACDPTTTAEARSQLRKVALEWAACTDSITSQQWLWAGTAHWLLSNTDSAIACLHRAVSQAEASGMAQVQRMALLDLVNVHEHCGEADKALAAFKLLRRLEGTLADRTTIPEWVAVENLAWEGPSPSDFKNPHLRRALTLLKDARVNYSVSTLAEACKVSRRTLENAFKEEMAQSVANLLQNRRLAIVRWRLISGRDSIKRVAIECGYPSASAMCHDFKRATGSSPGKFRMEFTPHSESSRTDD